MSFGGLMLETTGYIWGLVINNTEQTLGQILIFRTC